MVDNKVTLLTDDIVSYSDNYILNEKHYRIEKKWDISNTTTNALQLFNIAADILHIRNRFLHESEK